jgi:hypothetical protein
MHPVHDVDKIIVNIRPYPSHSYPPRVTITLKRAGMAKASIRLQLTLALRC